MRADIALVSAGDLRQQNVPVGSSGIKSHDVTALLMYPDDALVVLALDGRMIQQALETSVSGCPKPSLSFLQVSGIKMVFDPARPSGQRVTSVTVGGLPIVAEKSYTVAMLNSMANGALGYWKVWSKRNIVSGTSSATSASAVESFLKTNPKIDYNPQGRIVASK
jgi:2',3'-cyclic-nucleotide 2'-phosphodiesterase (5'-nucleotidase family)